MKLSQINFEFQIINGASGEKITVKEILNLIKKDLNKNEIEIVFNNQQKIGDPKYYHADMHTMFEKGWKPEIQLSVGLKKYTNWFSHLI